MKSRIQRKNVIKSIRRSQTGGGKKFEFLFWIKNNIANNLNGGEAKIYLDIIVKKPKKNLFSVKKEQNIYLMLRLLSDRLLNVSHDLIKRT